MGSHNSINTLYPTADIKIVKNVLATKESMLVTGATPGEVVAHAIPGVCIVHSRCQGFTSVPVLSPRLSAGLE